MTDHIIDTNVVPDSTGGHAAGQVGTTHSGIDSQNNGIRNTVRELLGDHIRLNELMSLGNLDYHTGFDHTTTSLPYAIHGSATVISRKVAMYIASASDPIKSILSVAIHKERKIIIKRRYVVGGQTLITPERAPARTVAVREDVREVMLTRYGGDLEMNLNLFLQPQMAAEELDMKIGAQREALEQTLNDIGYETIMNEGTNLVRALQRANPATSSMDEKSRLMAAERVYIQSIFGCMAKNAFPIHNIMAACSRANVYTPAPGGNNNGYQVMIVPAGMDLNKYTRPDEMVYSISGLKKTEHGKVEMPLANVMKDNTSNLRIMVYIPPASNSNGTANPQVEAGGLSEVVGWGTYYPLPEPVFGNDDDSKKNSTTGYSNFNKAVNSAAAGAFYCDAVRITDFKRRTWCTMQINSKTEALKSYATIYPEFLEIDEGITKLKLKGSGGEFDREKHEMILVRPKMMAMMSSAILCTKPGKETGELLMAYPSTGVSTSQSTEMMKMQLRCYLGCAIYEPENLLVIPDVQFEGVVAGQGCKLWEEDSTTGLGPFDPAEHDLILAFKTKGSDLNNLLEDEVFMSTAGKFFYGGYKDLYSRAEKHFEDDEEPSTIARTVNGADKTGGFETEDGVPLSCYLGTTETYHSGQWHRATDNAGHLGDLDCPRGCDRLDGIQKYCPIPGVQ